MMKQRNSARKEIHDRNDAGDESLAKGHNNNQNSVSRRRLVISIVLLQAANMLVAAALWWNSGGGFQNRNISSTTSSSEQDATAAAMDKLGKATRQGGSFDVVNSDNAVEIFRTFALDPPVPSKVPYNFDTKPRYFSQVGQDKAIDELLGEKEGGFFIEVGAYDGLTMSNSLFFEKSRGWTGLLIEANPRAYRELLSRDRKCWSTQSCISLSSQVELGVDFLAHGMVGGVGAGDANKFQGLQNKDKDNPYVYKVKRTAFHSTPC